MGDSFTNFLLVTLIALIAWIGRAAYMKIDELFDLVKSIAIDNASRRKDIEQLIANQDDHESRLRALETRRHV